MSQFLLDFQAFYTMILSAIADLWFWLTTTIIGEIIIFILVLYIFLFVLKLIISLKN